MTEKSTQKIPIANAADGETVDKVIEWLRKANKPQTADAITRRYIELLREAAGFKQ